MIRVLVVDDDDLTAAAHAEYVRRLDGFDVAGIAGSAQATVGALSSDTAIDLVLLDMNLPDGHGIDVARRLRTTGVTVDIIAITAVHDIEVVRSAMSLGIAQYLIKPFGFATFREKMTAYASYRERLATAPATQADIDTMYATLRVPGQIALPKGLSPETLETVLVHLKRTDAAESAFEIAETLELSRVTARRYLEHLAEAGLVLKSPRYGTKGRPELEYRWR